MAVNLLPPQAGDLHPVAGLRIGVVEAGVRKANRKDLTVFCSTLALRWPVCSPKTVFVPRLCSCAARIWPVGKAFGRW